jgi:hypothetical protein
MKKPDAPTRSIGVLALLALLAVPVGCSRGECTSPSKEDIDPARFSLWIQNEFDVPWDARDVVVGNGRLAQPDRRLFLRLSFSTPDAGELGAGPLVMEYPVVEVKGQHLGQRRIPFQDRLFGAIAGMREGGERRFTLRAPLQGPDQCQPHAKSCELFLDETKVSYPPDQDMTVTAHLDRLCAPTYCLQTEIAIPPPNIHRLVERSCR